MKIFIRRHGNVLAEQELLPTKDYILGRSDNADIQLTEQFISRRHGRLFFEKDQWWYQDLREGHENYHKAPLPIGDEKTISLEGELDLITADFLSAQKTAMFDPEQLPGSVGRSRKFKALVALTTFITFSLLGAGGYYTYQELHKPMNPNTLLQFVRPKVVEFELKRDEEVIEQIKKYAHLKDEDFKEGVGFCTGFMVAKNIVLTASHCVLGPSGFDANEEFSIKTSDGKRFLPTRILGFNIARDYLFLEVLGLEGYETLKMAKGYSIGEKIYTVGNVHGQGIAIREGITASKTKDETDESIEFLRFSAAASPGNSGGPLVNAYGEVVGLVFARSGWSENYNVATDVFDLKNGLDAFVNNLSPKSVSISTKGIGFQGLAGLFEMFDLLYQPAWEQYPEKTRPFEDIHVSVNVPRPLVGVGETILASLEVVLKEKFELVAKSMEEESKTNKELLTQNVPSEWTAQVSLETPLIIPFPSYDRMEFSEFGKEFFVEKKFDFYLPTDGFYYTRFKEGIKTKAYDYLPLQTTSFLPEAPEEKEKKESTATTTTRFAFQSDYWANEEKRNLDSLTGYSKKLFASLEFAPQTEWEPLRMLSTEQQSHMILGENGVVVSFIESPFLKESRMNSFTLNELPPPEMSIVEDQLGRKWSKAAWKLFGMHAIEQQCLALPQGHACLLSNERKLPKGLVRSRSKKSLDKEFNQYMVRPMFWDVGALIDFIAKGHAKNLHGLEDVLLHREADGSLTLKLKTVGITIQLKGNDIPKMLRIVPALFYNNGNPQWFAAAFTGYYPAREGENVPLQFCGIDVQLKNVAPYFDSATDIAKNPALKSLDFTIKSFNQEAELISFCQPMAKANKVAPPDSEYHFQEYQPKHYVYTVD